MDRANDPAEPRLKLRVRTDPFGRMPAIASASPSRWALAGVWCLQTLIVSARTYSEGRRHSACLFLLPRARGVTASHSTFPRLAGQQKDYLDRPAYGPFATTLGPIRTRKLTCGAWPRSLSDPAIAGPRRLLCLAEPAALRHARQFAGSGGRRARSITEGIPAQNVPACMSCHGEKAGGKQHDFAAGGAASCLYRAAIGGIRIECPSQRDHARDFQGSQRRPDPRHRRLCRKPLVRIYAAAWFSMWRCTGSVQSRHARLRPWRSAVAARILAQQSQLPMGPGVMGPGKRLGLG